MARRSVGGCARGLIGQADRLARRRRLATVLPGAHFIHLVAAFHLSRAHLISEMRYPPPQPRDERLTGSNPMPGDVAGLVTRNGEFCRPRKTVLDAFFTIGTFSLAQRSQASATLRILPRSSAGTGWAPGRVVSAFDRWPSPVCSGHAEQERQDLGSQRDQLLVRWSAPVICVLEETYAVCSPTPRE